MRFPIFVDKLGILSEKCTQPKESEEHLCGPDDVCSATDAVCPDYSDEPTVCLGSECGCSSSEGPTWYLQQNGNEVDCFIYQ